MSSALSVEAEDVTGTDFDTPIRALSNDICVEIAGIGFRLASLVIFPLFSFWVWLILSGQDGRLRFASYREFWVFCFRGCGDFKVGCAETCCFRKTLDIPPFRKSYLGKFEGIIPARLRKLG